jgi:type I restriction enzyme S subunit
MSELKESEYGRIPKNWNFIEASSYCLKVTDGTHDSPKEQNIGKHLVTSKHIKGRNIDFANAYLISESDYNKINERSKVDQWDVIISMIGEYCGFAYVERNSEINYAVKNVGLFKAGSREKAIWLYYFIQSTIGKNYLENCKSGTSQPYITLGTLRSFPILVPDNVLEQNAIVNTLSCLDDKIDLLNRQNITLEKMAEIIFKQKFIEEANEKWATKKVGEIVEVQNGYAFSSKDYVEFQEGQLEVLKMGHIERGGGLRANPKKDFVPRSEKLKRWILNKGDIIMAMTDMKDNVVILGVPAMIDKNDKYVLNQRVARLYLKTNDILINNYLLYIQLKDSEFIATLQSKANSGVQVNLSTETIKDCDIIVPPIEVQNESGKAITDLYLKKEQNDIQIKTLTSLRDNLLPKLMSGEASIEL